MSSNAWKMAMEAAAGVLDFRAESEARNAEHHKACSRDYKAREAAHVARIARQDAAAIRARLELPAFRAALEAEMGEVVEMLREALPLVREREYLEDVEYSYGSGWPEPSPAEWGINCGYQQTADAMPYDQFLVDVERHHKTNAEEDDGDGEFLTLANRIDALLSRIGGKP